MALAQAWRDPWHVWRAWWMARVTRPAAHGGAQSGAGNATNAADPSLEDFEGFVRKHERQILNYLWRMLADEETAYDLCQEVFVRAWQHFATIRDYAQPQSWLLRVATNLALNHRQRQKPLRLDESNDPGRSDSTAQVAEGDLVRTLLAQLAPKRRAALILREVYGFACAEIAPLLDMTPDAVKMSLSRAREQFRALYLREEGQR
jgi:RNA polymerase sigma-70 factor (ECF subfamily)